MAAGDVKKTFRFRKETVKSKTNTAVTKGDILVYDTDGHAPGTQTLARASLAKRFKKCVATESVAAVAATQTDLPVLAEGVIDIRKVAGALEKMQIVGLTATAGKVGAWTPPSLGVGVWCATTVQLELEKLGYAVGEVQDAAGSNDDAVTTVLGSI